jgi:hypothetical protein
MRTALLLIIIIIGGCSSFNNQSTLHEIEFVVAENNQTINKSEIKVVVAYGSVDTVEYASVDRRIKLPMYDSAMTFFSIRYKAYKSDFSGDFLKYELPTINNSSVTTWFINVDTPPFEKAYTYSTLRYVFHISTDKHGTNQVWTYRRQ